MEMFHLPTGILFTDDYSKGKLETLSIGDYGKQHNIKANFLGFKNPINGVPNIPCMPLSEKWVITLSTQYGCPMKCTFCDVPNIPFKGNASFEDLKKQLLTGLRMSNYLSYTDRLNIHFARMGEPIFNDAVFTFAEWMYIEKRNLPIRIETLHPVLTTSLPRGFKRLEEKLIHWCNIKNEVYNGQAGLQFSINSTDDAQRDKMFNGMSLGLSEFCVIAARLPVPVGRKYCLNFAYSTDYLIDAKRLRGLFNPEKFMVKITPIHNNNACRKNGIKTEEGYSSYTPYEKIEKDLIFEGFDVLVFIPSMDEEKSLVTCGNAILGGSKFNSES